MRINARFTLPIVLIVVLIGFAVIASRLYQERNMSQEAATAKKEEVSVTSGDDRGPGSLREALFVAAASRGNTLIATLRCSRVSCARNTWPMPPCPITPSIR